MRLGGLFSGLWRESVMKIGKWSDDRSCIVAAAVGHLSLLQP